MWRRRAAAAGFSLVGGFVVWDTQFHYSRALRNLRTVGAAVNTLYDYKIAVRLVGDVHTFNPQDRFHWWGLLWRRRDADTAEKMSQIHDRYVHTSFALVVTVFQRLNAHLSPAELASATCDSFLFVLPSSFRLILFCPCCVALQNGGMTCVPKMVVFMWSWGSRYVLLCCLISSHHR